MIQIPEKGERVPLHISPSDKKRLQVGISWNTDKQVVQKGLIVKREEVVSVTYDLDLFCCIYDISGEVFDHVTPENANLMDNSGNIYHSGDNQTGRISGDDEFISVNIALLPDSIYAIVFFALCADKSTFANVDGFEARVADGLSDENQLHVTSDTLEDANKDGFIFAALIRSPVAEHGWILQNICEFRENQRVSDWGEEGAKYIW